MASDPNLQPHGGDHSRSSGGGDAHLVDYWQVITRRTWLILLIFGVTTASAIWAASRQQIYFQSNLSLQVNDPLERTRSLVPQVSISSMTIYIDPVQSEMEVLKSATIAGEVVQALGLRLQPESPDIIASSLFREVSVAADVPEGAYEFIYDATGTEATLRSETGQALGSARVGTVLDAGGIRFTPRAPLGEERLFPLRIYRVQDVVGGIQGGISAQPRINTNIIDVQYVHADAELAPAILNRAVESLREYGARRVTEMAAREVGFIETRLDSARVQLDASMASILTFKESGAFTNLTLREQSLVNQSQTLIEQMNDLERRRSTFAETVRRLASGELREGDLVSLTAELAEVQSPQLQELIDSDRDARARLRIVTTAEGKTLDHPDARSVQAEIEELERNLQEALSANLSVVETRLQELDDDLGDVVQEQRQFPALENRLQALMVQQTTDEEQYRYLLTMLQQARITEAAATPYVDVIDPAVGSFAIQPRGRMNVLLGALLGLILGLGAAFFLEYLDRTVRTSSDVETLLGLPVLGVVPRLRQIQDEGDATATQRRAPLVVALDPIDPAAEAFRNLRMNLMFMNTEDSPLHTISVSSPGPEEGKSTTSLNFSIMLAQQGQRVLLIDADLRRPSLHRALDLLKEPGLTNLLVGEVDAREAIRPNVLPNLDFLPSGPFPPNPTELLSSKAMQRLVAEMEGKYGHVVIDTPPVLAATDAALLGAHTDGMLLVLRSGSTEQRAAERAVEQLRRVGVRLLGAVLNEVATTSSDESYYLQYYHAYRPIGEPTRLQKLRQGMSKVRFW